mmetsp:Transcript_25848/g.87216  ORF Transcript_25848/g.87216 Transcript_25848/m.87216 type:complete len:150 (+) Transcript_25848:303-752(+)
MTYYVGPGVPKGPAAHPSITKLGMLTAFIMANLWAYLLLPLGWIVFPCANLFALALSACVFCCSCGHLNKKDVEGRWPATIEFEGTPSSAAAACVFCCCGVSEGDSDAATEVDPEAPAPAPATGGAKKPTVPIPTKAYLTAMKKSHGLL